MHNAVLKVNTLVQLGVKINRDSSSDGLVAKVLDNVMPGYVGNALGNYLEPRDVMYLKQIYALLKKLGVNPGPKERSFWQVFSTETP